jgi:hypothetical protein
MSRMSEISLEIQVMLDECIEPATIAKTLGVPVAWVVAEQTANEREQREYEDASYYSST